MTSPSYSPTQSPTMSISPVYVAPDDSDSPPLSPKYTCSVVDLTSPYSPTDDSCSNADTVPPLPPLPPPLLQLPPPPPPPTSSPPPLPSFPLSFPDPVPTTVKTDEPLPPGEESPPVISQQIPSSSMGQLLPQDMEIDSGEEAENQFFSSQQNLFPASVWDFSKYQVEEKAKHISECPDQDKEQNEYSGKRRRNSSEDRVTKISKTDETEQEEDEESLRLLLLAQVSRAKGKNTNSITDGCENKISERFLWSR